MFWSLVVNFTAEGNNFLSPHSPDNGPQQRRAGFIVERDNYGGRWQVLRGVRLLPATERHREEFRQHTSLIDFLKLQGRR